MITLIMGLVVLAARITGRFADWAACWGLGNVAVGLGSLDYVFSPFLPKTVLTMFGNLLAIAGCVLVVQGFRLLAGRRAEWQRVAGAVAALSLLPIFCNDPDHYAVRVAFNDLMITCTDAWVMAEAIRMALRQRLRTAWILAGLFFASACVAFARSLLAIATIMGTDYLRHGIAGPWLAAGLATCWALRGTLPILVAAERSQQALTALATHDALTGALNRTGLDRLRAELVGGAALILIDLDHFKALNDRLGHAAGDHALRSIADAARRVGGPGARLARLGGDEFLLMLPGRSIDAAAAIADRLREAFTDALDHNGIGGVSDYGPAVTASIGIACGALAGDGFGRLLAQADEALYRSKRAGRDRISLVRTAA